MEAVVILAATYAALGTFSHTRAALAAPEIGAVLVKDLVRLTDFEPTQTDGIVFCRGGGQGVAQAAER